MFCRLGGPVRDRRWRSPCASSRSPRPRAPSLAVYDSLQAAGERGRRDRARGAAARRHGDHGRAGDRGGRGVGQAGLPRGRGAADRRARGRARGGRRPTPRASTRCCASRARRDVPSTEDPAERALIWKGRKSAFSAVGWLAPDYIVQDGVVPRTRLGEALAEIGRMSAATGIRVANVFHAGDGNLHPLILFDGREPGAVERAEALAGGHPAAVRRAGRLDHRRARRRRGEARLPPAHVLRGRPRADAPRARRGRPRRLANRGKMLPARRPRRHDVGRSTASRTSQEAVRDGPARPARSAAAPSRRCRRRRAATSSPSTSPPCAASSSTTRRS